MVGKPGDRVLIPHGDLYVSAAGADPKKNPELFQIQRKPRHVQEVLWRSVYDNDFVPRGLPRDTPGWQQPWTRGEGSGWDLGSGQAQRAFNFENRYSSGTLEFDPEKIPGTHALTDWLAYDEVHEEADRRASGHAGRRVKPSVS